MKSLVSRTPLMVRAVPQIPRMVLECSLPSEQSKESLQRRNRNLHCYRTAKVGVRPLQKHHKQAPCHPVASTCRTERIPRAYPLDRRSSSIGLWPHAELKPKVPTCCGTSGCRCSCLASQHLTQPTLHLLFYKLPQVSVDGCCFPVMFYSVLF